MAPIQGKHVKMYQTISCYSHEPWLLESLNTFQTRSHKLCVVHVASWYHQLWRYHMQSSREWILLTSCMFDMYGIFTKCIIVVTKTHVLCLEHFFFVPKHIFEYFGNYSSHRRKYSNLGRMVVIHTLP